MEAVKQADIRDKVFLFDIDGVINEPQQPITEEMRSALLRLSRHFQIYFVTGNTYVKTVDILNGPIAHFSGVFCNNADELRTMRGKLIWRDTETPPVPVNIEDTLRVLLGNGVDHGGNRIEWRNPRMLNFSHIGRFASQDMRKAHDASWRHETIDFLKIGYPDVEAVAGGAISLDIYSRGADKARACKYLNDAGKRFIFLGDKTEPGGNDHCVKVYCDSRETNISLTVMSQKHTIEIIEAVLERI